MKAEKIMNGEAGGETWSRTVWDCFWATRDSTDDADWLESWVLLEDTLNAEGIMEEAMK